MGLELTVESQQEPSLETPHSSLRALLSLAWPLVVSNSFTTIQITIDRLFLSRTDADMATASVAAACVFWLPFVLLWATASYVATFAAQYTGSGRPKRVGAAVWQGLYFSILAGIAFLALIPVTPAIFEAIDHSPAIQSLETTFFKCLCWYALPALITATTTAFFSGRSQSRVVLWINAVGLIVTATLDYVWIFGKLGFPAMGIAGAGWATVAGAWASAIVGLGLLWRRQYRDENGTLSQWRFDARLFWRFMRFGLPSGLQWMLEISAFNAFIIVTGWFGDGDLGATGLVITINNLAFIPMMGVGQAVLIMVGRYLGENRADRAAESTWLGLWIAGIYMGGIALIYVVAPQPLIMAFEGSNDPAKWAPIAEKVVVLLWFVAAFSIFDAANIVVAFGLRGAGDTLFVSLLTLCLAWPVMVAPTYFFAYGRGWGLYWAWAFATLYICTAACCLLIRFRQGKWRSMRVIESPVIETPGIS